MYDPPYHTFRLFLSSREVCNARSSLILEFRKYQRYITRMIERANSTINIMAVTIHATSGVVEAAKGSIWGTLESTPTIKSSRSSGSAIIFSCLDEALMAPIPHRKFSTKKCFAVNGAILLF